MSNLKRGGWPYGTPPNAPFELNTASPQAKGLVAWWPFLGDQLRYGVRDHASIYHLDTKVGAPGWIANGRQGWAYNATHAADAGWSHSGSVPVTAAPMTVTAWIYTIDNTVSEYAVSLVQAGVGVRFVLWCRGATAGDPLSWAAYDGVTLGQSASLGFPVNQWFHACGVEYASNNRASFINGGNKTTNATAVVPANVNGIYIGRSVGAGGGMSGMMCDIRIYNCALSDVEVREFASWENRWELYRPVVRWWSTYWSRVPLFMYYQRQRQG